MFLKKPTEQGVQEIDFSLLKKNSIFVYNKFEIIPGNQKLSLPGFKSRATV